jgi:hypothetical protein
MYDLPEGICPHLHRGYKTLNTPGEGYRKIAYYFCEIEGEMRRIDSPRCSGNRQFCDRENPESEK